MKDRTKIQRALVSVLLALLIWAGLQLQGEASRKITVPVEFVSIAEGLTVSAPASPSVSVVLQGLPARMARVDPEIVKVLVDLSEVGEGSTKFFLSEDRIRGLPPGLRVVEITPYSLSVRLEPVLEKDLPLQPRTTGKVADGYELDRIRLVPGSIRFSGPRSVGNAIESASTVKIDLDGLTESAARRVELDVDGKILPYLTPKVVDAEILVREKSAERTIKGVRVDPVPQPGLRVRLNPPQVDLVVSGPASKIRGLESASFEVQAEARGYGPGRHRKQKLRLTFRINPPREGIIFDYSPKEFDLLVTK
ncbi:MAG: CdaR family protein [Bdellovibrionota bacterium]